MREQDGVVTEIVAAFVELATRATELLLTTSR